MKKLFSILSFLLISLSAFSFSKTFTYPDYSLTAYYSPNLAPGDPLFVRLVFESKNKKLIKSLKDLSPESEGSLFLYKYSDDLTLSEKASTKSNFYKISREANKKNIKIQLLTAAPLSTWLKAGKYLTKISFKVFNKEESYIQLPLTISEKYFISETIPLNEANTAIKTNTSKTRMDQIDRLNKILAGKNSGAIYETGRFASPTPATRRTSFFGDRRTFAYSNGKSTTNLHYGIDYGIPTGQDVRSCGKGKVVMAEDRISTGWSVCIEHLPGLYSLYYHMSRLDVKVGDMVNSGDLLGLSGATGLATGPHLHWEVRLNMEAVNPDFFTGDFTFEKESIKIN
ncbi:MAG: M23 family metallopeptidase [Treponema sp.]|nr:M23 family metallopeptidase [Treponema sp.]